jgi:hypothetical protein
VTGSAEPSGGPTYEQAAWSWTEHLRGGGTTPWTGWSATGGAGDASVAPRRAVPGAAQLELLRRLWLERRPEDATRERLNALVLARSGPGRGRGLQPLSWPEGAPRFGAPPTDPALVPDEELLRLAAGVLADLVVAAPAPPLAAPPRRRLLSRAPAFVITGAPVTASVVRRELAASGLVEGGASPVVLLLAEPLDVALTQVWSARVQRGAGIRWRGFLDRTAYRRGLPRPVDVAALAGAWSARLGADRVHVVVAASGTAAATRSVGEVLGRPLTSGPAASSLQPRLRPLSPAATDVARRVNAVLRLRVADDRKRALVRHLSTVLAACDEPGPPGALAVPVRLRDWAEETAARATRRLLADGYPVHGDLGRLGTLADDGPTRPDVAASLRVALRACLEQADNDPDARKAEMR